MSVTETTSGPGPARQAANLDCRSFTIPSVDPGVHLYMRNKHLAGMTSFGPERTLLFVHGATYPGETTFDMPIEGISMMDLLALDGFDVYFFDIRGYGGSTRPPEMDQPATKNKPLAGTADAARDLGAAIDYILAARGISKLNLMGWSWGTSIIGAYTVLHNDKVNRLVIFDPAWVAPAAAATAAPLPAYRTVSKEAAWARWLNDIPGNDPAIAIPPDFFDAWWDAMLATDPGGSAMTPAVLRACNGIGEEMANYWFAGKPLYDPGGIEVPSLVVDVEWEPAANRRMALDYFEQLTRAPFKRIVELKGCTHMVMLEKTRMQLFGEISRFLTEADLAALK